MFKLLCSSLSFCKLTAGLGSPKFSSSSTLALSLLHFPFLRPSCYLTLFATSGRNYHFSHLVLSGYKKYSVIYFFRKMTWPMSWADWVPYSSHILTHVVSFLPLVSTLFFSRIGGVLSHQNSSPQRLLQWGRVCFDAADLMLPTRCQANSMPGQLDA